MSPPSQDTQPISLLCVDDDEWVLDILKIFFEREGDFSLFTCSSGSEALSLIGQYQFDAIIADYSMPDIDGITLLKEIRSQNDPALFIMFTGRHLAQVAIETLNNGGNYYMQKGVEIQRELPKVLEFIRTSVRNRRGQRTPDESDAWYRSVVEHQQDLLCNFLPDGTHYAHQRTIYPVLQSTSGTAIRNFLEIIPEEEREEVKKILGALTPENPGTYIEHHVLDFKGTPASTSGGTGHSSMNRVRSRNILPRAGIYRMLSAWQYPPQGYFQRTLRITGDNRHQQSPRGRQQLPNSRIWLNPSRTSSTPSLPSIKQELSLHGTRRLQNSPVLTKRPCSGKAIMPMLSPSMANRARC